MEVLFLIPLASLLVCLAIIPASRRFALKVGLVDQPDGRRKIHGRPVPVTGGLAVFVALWSVIGLGYLAPHAYQQEMIEHGRLLLGLFFATSLLVLLGIADAFGKLRGRHKLLGQVVAIGIVISFGLNIKVLGFFGYEIPLPEPISWLLSCFLLLGAINSINLIDGMDGLLGSVGLWLSLTIACMAGLAEHWWAVLPALALAGALLGFLRFNLPPASIFMGDAGSMVVGLTLGTLAIQCSIKGPTTMAVLLPLGLFTIPFFDTFAAIVRRKLTGRSIYTTDRGHLHHCMLRRGFSTSVVLVLVSVCCLIACAGVVASQAFKNHWIVVITTASIVGVLIFTRVFGFAEAMLIKERLLGLFQPTRQTSQMEVRLQGSGDWQRLWILLTDEASKLNLQQMVLDVNAPSLHESYHARWSRFHDVDEAPSLWRFEIPLSSKGHAIGRLLIAGQPDQDSVSSKIATLECLVETYTNNSGMIAATPSRPALELPSAASVGA